MPIFKDAACQFWHACRVLDTPGLNNIEVVALFDLSGLFSAVGDQ